MQPTSPLNITQSIPNPLLAMADYHHGVGTRSTPAMRHTVLKMTPITFSHIVLLLHTITATRVGRHYYTPSLLPGWAGT
jgi:hypothetical protein